MRREPNSQEHRYAARLEWTGQGGPGPMEYATYGRSFRVRVQGNPELIGSADPVFRDASKFNPEDLLVISVAGSHMPTYLALCARRGVTVLAYDDKATGTLEVHSGGAGKFVEITLHPVVTISEDSDEALARELHHPRA